VVPRRVRKKPEAAEIRISTTPPEADACRPVSFGKFETSANDRNPNARKERTGSGHLVGCAEHTFTFGRSRAFVSW
jgi:hypothetical protein